MGEDELVDGEMYAVSAVVIGITTKPHDITIFFLANPYSKHTDLPPQEIFEIPIHCDDHDTVMKIRKKVLQWYQDSDPITVEVDETGALYMENERTEDTIDCPGSR